MRKSSYSPCLYNQSSGGIVDFAFIFLTIDTIFGEKYFSGQAAMNEALSQLIEFDPKILGTIQTYKDFEKLMADQLTLSSVISKYENISLIYQLLRQFSMKQILDPALVSKSGKSNIFDLDFLTHFDTTDLQIHDITLAVIFSIFKVIQMKAYVTEITFIISDHDVVRQLLQENTLSIIMKLLRQYKQIKIRLILQTTDPRLYLKDQKIPVLYLSKFNEHKNQYRDILKIGSGIEIEVRLI